MRTRLLAAGIAVAGAVALALPAVPALATPGHSGGSVPITDISHACLGQNSEVEQAVDPALGFIYEEWIGCNGIGFARSTDGGRTFSKPVQLPGSPGGWDPALALAPNGTVYAAFMNGNKEHSFPVVDASFNHGRSFPQSKALIPRKDGNWGDRDFIAVAPNGDVYVTWDYGPSAKKVKFICPPNGSCAFSAGDLNVVVQKSTDGGKRWGPIIHISPGFPASGADSAPLIVEPDGTIEVLYQGYKVTNRKTYALAPAHQYFTSSANGGATWSAPVRLGPARLTMSLGEWWIDGALGRDAAGNLYATWDTQRRHSDIGWISFSRNHGKTWSALHRVTPDRDAAVHIVQVAGGPPGIAYVAWLADNSPNGYALYLRTFSLRRGWLGPPVRVSRQFGSKKVWPGDTIGISTKAQPVSTSRLTGPQNVYLSWGSAVSRGSNPASEIFATVVRR